MLGMITRRNRQIAARLKHGGKLNGRQGAARPGLRKFNSVGQSDKARSNITAPTMIIFHQAEEFSAIICADAALNSIQFLSCVGDDFILSQTIAIEPCRN